MTRTSLSFPGLAVLLALTPLAVGQKPKPEPRLPEGARAHRNLEYVKDGHERHKLDLYLPARPQGRLPLIVWIHGGAWQGGSKDNPPALSLLERGYAVASVNYRLSSHARFPAQIEDCKAALRWLRTSATIYGLDPDRIGVWGASAGGHLAALLGVTAGVKEFEGNGGNADQSSRVQCVVDFFGPSNLLTMARQSGPDSRIDHDSPTAPEARLIGGPVQEHKEKAAKASPVSHVNRDAAAFLIVHGDKDPVVPCGQSEELAAALKKAGALVTLKKIEGAGHGGREFNTPENRKLVELFFDEHLKGAKR